MNYILRHWNGELPLRVAFWVNVVLINLALRGLDQWLGKIATNLYPVTAMRLSLAIAVVSVFIIYPWQLIGAWRTARNYEKNADTGFWGGAARFVLVLGLIATVVNLAINTPLYRDMFKIGFQKDEFADYEISITSDGALLHLEGSLGFGVSDDVKQVLANNDSVKGIILDSVGGRVYEGRQLASIISDNKLDTYSFQGCYSACGTAYIAGATRFLGKGANLAFHQYWSPEVNIAALADLDAEQKADLLIYRKHGVSEEFLERIFTSSENDLWYPTVQELLSWNVVHQIIDRSDVTVENWGEIDTREIEETFLAIPAFAAIKKYDPDAYAQIVTDMSEKLQLGANDFELQQTIGKHIEVLAMRMLPASRNETLIKFVEATGPTMEKLRDIDPILCMKYLFPEDYGAIKINKYLSEDDMMPMLDALSQAIIDRYESTPPGIDAPRAQAHLSTIVEKLGEDALYFGGNSIENSNDYSKACGAIINLYELILAEDKEAAANILRYMFSQ